MTTTTSNPNIGIGSVVRGHQFRRGIIVRYENSTGFPIVHFDHETRAYAVNPGQLMSELEYLRITQQEWSRLPHAIRVNHSRECHTAGIANTGQCTEPEHCALIAAQHHAGDALEAYLDGAIPVQILDAGTTAIEHEHRRLDRDYDRAKAALTAYRRGSDTIH